MKRILVLGGTGAMGVYLVKLLSSEKDMEVLVTSRSPRENFGNVRYLLANARDPKSMDELLSNNHYDCIVDFMNYNYEEFEVWHKRLLEATDHYVFLSSSRVYANSETPLTEDSARLLETTTDKDFLATNRYALRKAREENMLKSSGKKNFTIIRPYITYSNRRLQLGICEKEDWLYRVLNDKEILFSEGVLDNKTTLTYGDNVSYGIANLIKNTVPNGEAIHITTEETMTWKEILCLYSHVIKEETNKDINIYTSPDIWDIELVYEGGYNTIYDRRWNRSFSNAKAEKICGHIDYMPMREGLESCLRSFIKDWKEQGNSIFLKLNEEYHRLMDDVIIENKIIKNKVNL